MKTTANKCISGSNDRATSSFVIAHKPLFLFSVRLGAVRPLFLAPFCVFKPIRNAQFEIRN